MTDPNDVVQEKVMTEDKSSLSRRNNPRRHTITMGKADLSHEACNQLHVCAWVFYTCNVSYYYFDDKHTTMGQSHLQN